MDAKSLENKTPVPVTRGSKHQQNPDFLSQNAQKSRNPIVAQKLHWIEGTFSNRDTVDVPDILSQTAIEIKAFDRYSVGSLFDDGRILLTNPNRPEMGTHIIWSGDACDLCPIEPEELVTYLHFAKFKFTRIDMAIDAIDFNLKPQHATREIKYGRIKTRASKSLENCDPRNPGYTQYVGTKKSEIYLKLYDKAAEMGIDADHTRIELTVQGKRAPQAAAEIVRRTDYRRLVVAFADFPKWKQWNRIMAVAPVKLRSERKASNTEQWLLDQCAPALAKVIYFSKEGDFFEKFTQAVTDRLLELSNNRQTVH